MLTPEQVAAYRDAARKITDPMTEYLLKDIAQRVAQAGQLTSTAAYEIWVSQQLGTSQRQIKAELRKILKASHRKIRQLLTQAAEVGYDFDIKHLPQIQAVKFEDNGSIQQIVKAAVALAESDFTNLTQTIGMVDPYGQPLPLQDAYRACTDFAFKQVSTGATDYMTACRQATRKLANTGLLTIEYKSGVKTSLEAAVRRNIMGGLGLMQEQISQQNHDDLGANGWEIDAHRFSAPDHEPIQGKQYSDAAYKHLSDSLHRRIGTLNCGHSAFAIILGVNEPQYSDEQLEAFREENERGFWIDGVHYTGYETTQVQRRFERGIREHKRRIMVDEQLGDGDNLAADQGKLTVLKQEYQRFSKMAGLRTEVERMEVAQLFSRATGGPKQTGNVDISVVSTRNNSYNSVERSIRDIIKSDKTNKKINVGNQNKHIKGANGYNPEKSYIYGDIPWAQELVDRFHGTGRLVFDRHGNWSHKEIAKNETPIGAVVFKDGTPDEETRRFTIHYGKNGTHIVPAREMKPDGKPK